jgi:uncharacterized protein YebE (UPF0316 family)
MAPVTLEALLFGGLIFLLRVINYAISTIRLVFIARNRRFLAAVFAFAEAFIFAVVMTRVVTDLNNSVVNMIAYCLGASVGSYAGMALESRFITSFSTLTIIARQQGQEIAEALRNTGYGATLTRGEGRDGEVVIVRCSGNSRDVPGMLTTIRAVNPEAFIEIESARVIERGWLPGSAPVRHWHSGRRVRRVLFRVSSRAFRWSVQGIPGRGGRQ